MLNALRHYTNLGTPNYFFQLLSEMNSYKDVIWKIDDIQRFFYNKLIDGKSIFDGCIDIAIEIELLLVNEGIVVINDNVKNHLNNIEELSNKVIELFFQKLGMIEEVYNIFSSKHIHYDVIYGSTQINNAAFSFKYANIKQFLLDFSFMEVHPILELNSFIINNKYQNLFDKLVLPEIKKRKISVEELKNKLELQQLYGEEAELFVVQFEEKRLQNKKNVQWVAQYVANQGYDIASYDTVYDEKLNRFIEVKSYEGDIPYFFWSRNEYLEAKSKKDSYWLYLVDRKQIKNEDYSPIMEQDPYKNVLMSGKWEKQVDKYKITLL